jgi:hypothetical protein
MLNGIPGINQSYLKACRTSASQRDPCSRIGNVESRRVHVDSVVCIPKREYATACALATITHSSAVFTRTQLSSPPLITTSHACTSSNFHIHQNIIRTKHTLLLPALCMLCAVIYQKRLPSTIRSKFTRVSYTHTHTHI